MRIEYLRDLATQKCANGGKIDSEIKKLEHIEEQRRSHAKIKYVTKPHSRDGVTSILIPAANEYSDPNDQKNYLNVEIMWRLLKAAETFKTGRE